MRLQSRPSPSLKGVIAAPPDKSISHRALILGAMAEGVTEIENLLESADVLATAKAVEQLGAKVERLGPGRWRVEGRPWASPAEPLDFGNSGTGCRLMMGAVSGRNIEAVFTGDESLSGRPMGRVLDPLRDLGATCQAREGGLLPATVSGVIAAGDHVVRPQQASAQVKSALLLAAAGMARGGMTIEEIAPTRDHTERMLEAFGADIDYEPGRAVLRAPVRLEGRSLTVPGDPSSAMFALAAGCIVPGSDLELTGVMTNPRRTGALNTLGDFGAAIALAGERSAACEPTARVSARHAALHAPADPGALAARAPDQIDEYPILAVLAAFAEGVTRFEGVAELRKKESDRIAMTAAGLRACGVEVEEWPSGFAVHGKGAGGVRGGAAIETHGDHRIAMSFLVLGLAAQEPVSVDRADMIATSYPGFKDDMAALGADIVAL